MTDLLTIRQSVRTSWLMAHLHAVRATLWSEHHPFVALGLLYGALAYLGFAVLIGVPGQAILALMIVGPAAVWSFGRYGASTASQPSRLNFFTWDSGPLRLSEDILSSKIVYCIGVRNEGTKIAGSVRVNIDSVEGHPRPTSEASLPIFRTPDNSADLQPSESEYFCVMRMINGASEDDGRVVICCHHDLVAPSFGIQELVDSRTMTLSACSEGAPRTTKQIQISSKREAATWSLHFELLPNNGEAPTRVVERRPVARPLQVKEAWDRVRSKLSQLGEASIRGHGKKGLSRETSERTGRPQRTTQHAVTQGERIGPDVLQAAKGTSLGKGTQLDAIAKEELSAQSERIRRLLARQARA
jgi:hypothetical protein